MSVFLIVKGRHFLFVRVQSHAFTLVLCHNGKKKVYRGKIKFFLIVSYRNNYAEGR